MERDPRLALSAKALRANHPFQLLWLSNLLFFTGVWSQTLMLGWLCFEATRSEFLVAVFTAVRFAPLLLGPVAGVWADRHNRVILLLVSCVWAAGSVCVLAVVVSNGAGSYPVLLLGALALGVAEALSQPARSSLVVDLVGRTQLSAATALNAIALTITQIVGPALGGTSLARVGATGSLCAVAGFYALSFLLLVPLRRVSPPTRRHSDSVRVMIVTGLRLAAGSRVVTAVLLVTLASNCLIWPLFQSFMPVFAHDILGLDAAGLGSLLACCSVGALIGSLIIVCLGDFRRKWAVFSVGTMAWGLAWAVFALSSSLVISFVVIAVIGVLSAVFGSLRTTVLLLNTSRDIHGRIMGLQELAIGAIPIGALILGALAQQFGVVATTFTASAVLVAVTIGIHVHFPDRT